MPDPSADRDADAETAARAFLQAAIDRSWWFVCPTPGCGGHHDRGPFGGLAETGAVYYRCLRCGNQTDVSHDPRQFLIEHSRLLAVRAAVATARRRLTEEGITLDAAAFLAEDRDEDSPNASVNPPPPRSQRDPELAAAMAQAERAHANKILDDVIRLLNRYRDPTTFDLPVGMQDAVDDSGDFKEGMSWLATRALIVATGNPSPVVIAKDGRCADGCQERTCPLGRIGSQDRCTADELAAAGVATMYPTDASATARIRIPIDLRASEVSSRQGCSDADIRASEPARDTPPSKMHGSSSRQLDDRPPAPIPMILHCPLCHVRHIDVVFADKPHHTHACQSCGHCWRPAVVPTVGVQFLPGFKDGGQ